MSTHRFRLSDARFARPQRLSPSEPRGAPRVDDRRVSGVVHVIRDGLTWPDAPVAYGPHETLRGRFMRGSRAGVSAKRPRRSPPAARASP